MGGAGAAVRGGVERRAGVAERTALALADHGAVAGTAAALVGVCQFTVGAIVPPLASVGGVSALTMAVAILVVALTAGVVLVLSPPRR
ncbi:hypothetical protein [Pseudonocardia sp. NPDC049154]|uniref:hypothetical protein n=1 Tax=Pseudonocardia sp. NPDC049154 TaxID=3155501 RepID=UPI0033E865B6